MAERARILIVDDEKGIRQVIRTNLVMQGHEALEAKNGQQALEVLANEEVDLMILDVMMPGTNGWQVLEAMRDQPEVASVPVMLLTAVTTEEEKVRGFELGASDYMTKPFAVGELLARVQRILNEKAEKEALAEFSITDWVTGLFNRAYLELRLGQEVARAQRYNSELTAMFFEIDQLPELVEAKGPHYIDGVLQQFASVVRGQIRACDLVFRYDGDFFFTILPDTGLEGGVELAERLRSVIEREDWKEGVRLTASFGVVGYQPPETPDEFLARAEDALASAKGTNGNTVWSALGGTNTAGAMLTGSPAPETSQVGMLAAAAAGTLSGRSTGPIAPILEEPSIYGAKTQALTPLKASDLSQPSTAEAPAPSHLPPPSPAPNPLSAFSDDYVEPEFDASNPFGGSPLKQVAAEADEEQKEKPPVQPMSPGEGVAVAPPPVAVARPATAPESRPPQQGSPPQAGQPAGPATVHQAPQGAQFAASEVPPPVPQSLHAPQQPLGTPGAAANPSGQAGQLTYAQTAHPQAAQEPPVRPEEQSAPGWGGQPHSPAQPMDPERPYPAEQAEPGQMPGE